FTKTLGDESADFIEAAISEINAHHGDFINGNYVEVNSRERILFNISIPVSGLDDLVDVSLKALPEGKERAKQALKKAQMVIITERLEAIKNDA
ncbi:hypothetical protein, partial [Streptococcus suis]|uniref:hypothetical protein n=1 Tax=Streptococcus suis TaxID=1307 RepID=UPI003CFA973F